MNGKFAKSEISLLYATDRSNRWSQSCSYSVLLCGLFYGALHVQSCIVLRFRTFFNHFSIVITLLGEERAVLNLNIHTS